MTDFYSERRKALPLRYEQFGTNSAGMPLVILHGLFGSSSNWYTIGKMLSAAQPDHEHFSSAGHSYLPVPTASAVVRPVVIPDLRNHGASPHAADMDYPLMAQDVMALVERLGYERVYVMGHSMGGKVAMELSLAYPITVAALIVADIAPKPYPLMHSSLLDALRGLCPGQLESRAHADTLLRGTIPDVATRSFLLQNLRPRPEGGYAWRINLSAISANYENLAAWDRRGRVYPGPALFIRGGLSPYILDEDIPSIREHFPRASLHSVAGAGHWVHVDGREEFMKTVEAFLSELSR